MISGGRIANPAGEGRDAWAICVAMMELGLLAKPTQVTALDGEAGRSTVL